jgi:hypothetical protein
MRFVVRFVKIKITNLMKTAVFISVLIFWVILSTGFSCSSETTPRETIKTFNGKYRGIVKAGEKPGSIILIASAAGIKDVSVNLKSE